MTTHQYRYFGRFLFAFAVLASVTLFVCAGGLGALVMWIAPDVGTGPRHALIESPRTGDGITLS